MQRTALNEDVIRLVGRVTTQCTRHSRHACEGRRLHSSRPSRSGPLCKEEAPRSGCAYQQTRSFHSSRPSRDSNKDFYELLGVSKSATQPEIKKAFYQAAKKYHPDANKDDPNAQKKFADVSNAYEVLSDEQKRQMYDAQGHEAYTEAAQGGGHGGHPFGGHSAEEILRHFGFSDMFNMGGGRDSGADIQMPLTLEFMEAVEGCEKEVTFTAAVPCTTCDGSGAKPGSKKSVCRQCGGRGTETASNGFFAFNTECRSCKGSGETISNPCSACKGKGQTKGKKTVKVKIPPGVNKGMNIRLAGQGEAGTAGAKPGSLFIHLSVNEHELFKREELDIHVSVPVTLTQAILGATVRVPTLSGEVDIKVPAGTQPEAKHVLRFKGVRAPNSNQYGHQYVHFKITIPKYINSRQKELLEEFEKLDKEHPQEGFWAKAIGRWRDYLKRKETK